MEPLSFPIKSLSIQYKNSARDCIILDKISTGQTKELVKKKKKIFENF